MAAPSVSTRPATALLTVTVTDVGELPIEPGKPTTAKGMLAQDIHDEMAQHYQGQISDHLKTHPTAADPWGLEADHKLMDKATALAGARLDKYDADLKAFIQAAAFRLIHLKELVIGGLLDLNEIRHGGH